LGGGGQAVVGRPLQPGALRVHADHPARLDEVAAEQLVHEVGADVARPDDRGGGLSHGVIPQLNSAVTVPSPANSARNTLPGLVSIARVQEPGRLRCPASSLTPKSATFRASQATQAVGLPRTALVLPLATSVHLSPPDPSLPPDP